MLYGYGGFNVSLTPSFSITMPFGWKTERLCRTQLTWWWRIREKWHDAGTKCKNKMYLMISLQQPT
jgi:prolyl oligopeptidase PreP (S9A serine peptidase family)